MPIELSPALPALPLPAVLAGAAGAVLGTAAALSSSAARRPGMRSDRWMRPLGRLDPVVGSAPLRAALRVLGAVAGIALVAAIARADGPVTATAVFAWVAGASLVAGPAWRLVNPARIARPTAPAAVGTPASVWPAVVALAPLGLALTLSDRPAVVAGALAAHWLVHALVGAWRGAAWYGRGEPLEVLATLCAGVAAIGCSRGRVVLRNPIVAATHAPMPDGALAFCSLVIALSITQVWRAQGWWQQIEDATGAVGATGAVALLFAAVAGALRLGIIRGFFRSAVVPLTAAYALLSGGRWAAPVDLVVFVALHAVAVALLHRQALARHDLRTARAVQFPPRVVVLTSVVAGLALLAPT